jgi:acetoin utilization deacetylase AcuC-like enzyme
MKKKIIFHEDYYQVYTHDPAAEAGRMEAIVQELQDYEFIKPQPATDKNILLVHTDNHLSRVKHSREALYDIALLAVGGTILAAETAYSTSDAMFALIRPPGHHASPEGCWGFCYFNNIAIAMTKLLVEEKITKAIIVDFDLHHGDGTDNTFARMPEVKYCSVKGSTPREFINNMERFLTENTDSEIIGVSAGFDRHIDDWGRLLSTDDYHSIGNIIKNHAMKYCSGRRFGVLEGGYNHNVLGKNVRAFCEGFY